MGPYQLLSIPGDAWPGVPRPEVAQLWAVFQELERTQWLPAAELIEGQLTQLRALLTHCVQHVPFYSESLRHANVTPAEVRSLEDVRRLPRLSRRTVQEQLQRLLASALPTGSKATTVMRTSGTSGMPIEIRQTNVVNLWWFAFHLRDFLWCGVDPRGTFAALRGLGLQGAAHQAAMEGREHATWNSQFAGLFETGPGHSMDVHQEPSRQLQWLLRVQPDYLVSYPPNLEHLAGLLLESGQRLTNLRTILTVGETLTEEARASIEAGFGVPVKTTYTCVEAGYLASPCPKGHGLHVHGENVIVEVLDDADQPCKPGETGRVVLTTLQNFLMPLIRYEILDAATVGPERCPCGRGLPLLTRVEGKQRPQFRLADGRRKDSGFLVRQLRKLGGYHQHQIVQEALDRLIVRVIPSRAWTPANTTAIRQWVQEYFEAVIEVDVRVVDRLEMTRAGKVRDVVVNVDSTS